MITEAAGFALVAGIGLSQIRAQRAARARAERAAAAERVRAVQSARRAAGRRQWAGLARAGWLPVIATAADPGNPGRVLRLCRDPHGLAGRAGGRVLLAVNGSASPDGTHTTHALPVPAHLGDPLTAAAWTYDDPDDPVRCTPATYAALTRRT